MLHRHTYKQIMPIHKQISGESGYASVFLDEYWQADSMRNTPLERIQDGSVGKVLIA